MPPVFGDCSVPLSTAYPCRPFALQVAKAAGPARASRSGVVVRAAVRSNWLPGNDFPAHLENCSLPANFGFDPLGLGANEERLKWFAESERVHCRWAMLGVAGILAQVGGLCALHGYGCCKMHLPALCLAGLRMAHDRRAGMPNRISAAKTSPNQPCHCVPTSLPFHPFHLCHIMSLLSSLLPNRSWFALTCSGTRQRLMWSCPLTSQAWSPLSCL